MEPVKAETPRTVPAEMPARPSMVGLKTKPAGGEAPGEVPPEMSDEIPDGLINDDLLGERL